MGELLSESRLASLVAEVINRAFTDYHNQHQAITGRAQTWFEGRDWPRTLTDNLERLELYQRIVEQTVEQVRELCGSQVESKMVWVSTKAVYSHLIAGQDNWELAETFFNSITRKIFVTVGVDSVIEFINTDFDTPPNHSDERVYRTYRVETDLSGLFETILSDFSFGVVPYEDARRDAQEIARRVERVLGDQTLERAEIIRSVFYRGKGAYVIGRLVCPDCSIPLTLALINTSSGIVVNALVTGEEEVAVVFSLTHTYFQVQADRPYDLVHYLQILMPYKKIAELYTALGYNKHGKTEQYRDLLTHLATAQDQFETARGLKGMVMVVFTLPSYTLVFKIIRDRFAYPKQTTRQNVMRQYRMVFQHDRAGRLIDAQEFENLKLSRQLFSPALLEELQRETSQSVVFEDEYVLIKHLYTEQRVIPLNLYLPEAPETSAQKAIIDCGNTIKDLACTNIFTGDMLLKNFGVTRHGRVVFYDYDELCMVTDCNFRALPQSNDDDEEMSAEPWYSVGENDVFPEEFSRFLGVGGSLREAFLAHHADLFTVEYWQQVQNRLRQGQIVDIFPYDQSKHLPGPNREGYYLSDLAQVVS